MLLLLRGKELDLQPELSLLPVQIPGWVTRQGAPEQGTPVAVQCSPACVFNKQLFYNLNSLLRALEAIY